MTKSAFSGPLIAYGQRLPLGNAGPTNPDLAPSVFWGGVALLDPRLGYNVTRRGVLGFLGTDNICVINQVPSAIAAANIAASQSPGSGAISLVSSSGAGITVTSSASVVWPSGNSIASGALAIDGVPELVQFGTADISSGYTIVSLYDPTKAIGRNLRYTSGGNDSGITFTATGYDVYGYPIHETVTGANAGVASGAKAFKFVTSITHTGSVASTLSVGTGDVYGFPIYSQIFGDVSVVWNSARITANSGYTAGVTTTATATTGDVRGTYAVQSASDGTKSLQVFSAPLVANVGSITGLFGVTQF
jgi:hypothetical protein